MAKELYFIKNRNKFLCGLLMVILLFALFPVRAHGAAEQPYIALSYIPAYGEVRNIEGVVVKENGGDLTTSDCRITLYLQIYEGGTYWVKPSYDTPCVNINEDGTFSIPYVTGGVDEQALFLHILLIPSDYTPYSGFEAAREAALDYVLVSRTREGAVSVTPENRVFQRSAETNAVLSDLPAPAEKLAVNVGFYTDGSAPGSTLSEELIRRQLEAASAFADTVRFYSSSGELYKAYNIAHTMGLSVIGTAWLSGNEEADRAELDALIEHCNNGFVSVACVGSETLLRGDLTAAALINDMEYVRERLTDRSVPVTTADTVSVLIASPEISNACDLLMPNIYPYWNDIEISEAAAYFGAMVDLLKNTSEGKKIIISETGWPTEGETVGKAQAGEREAHEYFNAIRAWSLSQGIQVLWFEAADEPWKTVNEGEAGAHWGILSTEFEVKDCYNSTDFFQRVK